MPLIKARLDGLIDKNNAPALIDAYMMCIDPVNIIEWFAHDEKIDGLISISEACTYQNMIKIRSSGMGYYAQHYR